MANPQKEDGHIDIANDIADALMKINISAYQNRVLWAIWRKTYGWHKKEDWISHSQISEMTQINKGHVTRALVELKERKIVTQSGNKLAFNKDYDQWQKLPNGVTPYRKVTQSGNKNTKVIENKDKLDELPNGVTVTQPGKIVTQSGKFVTQSGTYKRNYTKEKIQKTNTMASPLAGEDKFFVGDNLASKSTATQAVKTATDSIADSVDSGTGIEAKGRQTTEKRIKIFIDFAYQRYKAKFNTPLLISGGKDGKLVKELLQTFELDKLQELWLDFLDSKDEFINDAGRSIGVFYSVSNKLVSGCKKNQQNHDEVFKQQLEESKRRMAEKGL